MSKVVSDKKNKKLVTLTAARPPARFGAIKILGNKVEYFKEKSKLDEGWINGGFFVMQPEFLNYIKMYMRNLSDYLQNPQSAPLKNQELKIT